MEQSRHRYMDSVAPWAQAGVSSMELPEQGVLLGWAPR